VAHSTSPTSIDSARCDSPAHAGSSFPNSPHLSRLHPDSTCLGPAWQYRLQEKVVDIASGLTAALGREHFGGLGRRELPYRGIETAYTFQGLGYRNWEEFGS